MRSLIIASLVFTMPAAGCFAQTPTLDLKHAAKDLKPVQAPQQLPAQLPQQLPAEGDFASISAVHEIIPHGYPTEGVLIGQGWSTFFDRKASGFCVVGNVNFDSSIASTHIDYQRIDDKEQLFRSLEMSASASYSGGFFSASGKVDFANSVSVETSALNVLASVRVDSEIQTLIPASIQKGVVGAGALQLTADAKNLRNTDPLAFEDRCGDSFVISIRTGGEFDAYLQLLTSESESKGSLFASLKASGLGGSGAASFKSILDDKQSHQKFEYKLFQTGKVDGLNPTSTDKLIEKFSSFGTTDKFVPSPFEIYIVNYSQLENGDSSSGNLPSNEFMTREANEYARLTNLYFEYSDVIANPGRYFTSFFTDDLRHYYEVADHIVSMASLIDKELTECFAHKICEKTTVLQRRVSFLAGLQKANNPVSSAVVDAMLIEPVKSPDPEAANLPQSDASPENSYYLWLASLPFRRDEINPKSFLFSDSSKTYKDGAKSADHESLKQFTILQVKQWLLVNRLMPVSQSFCSQSMRHWMCRSPTELRKIIDQVSVDAPDAYLLPDPAPSPPPPVASPPPSVPPPRQDPHFFGCQRAPFC